ncbi:hypothetical protein Dimus_020429, partial [Dionaea muscipula]
MISDIYVDGQALRLKMKVKVDKELQLLAKGWKETDQGKHIHDFFLALATCNTIVQIATDSDDPTVKLIDYQ